MSLKKSKYLIFFVLIFSVLFLLILIRKPTTEKPLTKEDFESDTYTVIEESEGIVENLPELPQYPNAQVAQSKYYTEEGGEGYSLELSTNDSIFEVIEWYKEKLNENDWNLTFESEMTDEPTYFLIEYKIADIQLEVSVITQKDGSNRIIITHRKGMGEFGPPEKYE